MKGVPLNEELYQYITGIFAEEDDILKNVVKDAESKSYPMIQVSPDLGKFLYMLIKMVNAKKALEIGTLAGYSSIWLARALPDNAQLTTLEIDLEHAETAKSNFIKAGLDSKIELIFGNAMDSLEKLKSERFDFVFIDADKTGYPDYFDKVMLMMNQGGIIAADNTLRKGQVIQENTDEGTQAIKVYNKKVANDPRVESLLVPISDGLTICWVK
jgi:predicted O-methyltransferase YrrM